MDWQTAILGAQIFLHHLQATKWATKSVKPEGHIAATGHFHQRKSILCQWFLGIHAFFYDVHTITTNL